MDSDHAIAGSYHHQQQPQHFQPQHAHSASYGGMSVTSGGSGISPTTQQGFHVGQGQGQVQPSWIASQGPAPMQQEQQYEAGQMQGYGNEQGYGHSQVLAPYRAGDRSYSDEKENERDSDDTPVLSKLRTNFNGTPIGTGGSAHASANPSPREYSGHGGVVGLGFPLSAGAESSGSGSGDGPLQSPFVNQSGMMSGNRGESMGGTPLKEGGYGGYAHGGLAEGQAGGPGRMQVQGHDNGHQQSGFGQPTYAQQQKDVFHQGYGHAQPSGGPMPPYTTQPLNSDPSLPPAMTYRPFQFRPAPNAHQIETFSFPGQGQSQSQPSNNLQSFTYPKAIVPKSEAEVQPHYVAIPVPQPGYTAAYYTAHHPEPHPHPHHQPQTMYAVATGTSTLARNTSSQSLAEQSYIYPATTYHSAATSRVSSVEPSSAMNMTGGGPPPGYPPGVVFSRAAETKVHRPKVKLTYDDKRRIVEIARSNTSLRQEDIAQQYGVDRSTISKILLQAHRWTGPPQPPVVPIPKLQKSAGGRFPAIEHEMMKWWDEQDQANLVVKDHIAREKAKDIARTMGFGEDRFKASVKWLEKFKERRRSPSYRNEVAESAAVQYATFIPSTTLPPPTGYVHGAPSVIQQTYPMMSASMCNSPATGPLSRSQSSTTLASTDSSSAGGMSLAGSQLLDRSIMHGADMDNSTANGSISNLSSISNGLNLRGRSRSSPQPLEMHYSGQTGYLDPASGRAQRSSAMGLQRSNSYRVGAVSPSPAKRPATLHRSQSSTSSVSSRRGNRPLSLAASAFGLTPLPRDDNNSPLPSPSGSIHNTPTKQSVAATGQATALQPFMNSLSGIAISPGSLSAGTLSSSSSTNSILQHAGGSGHPLTPISRDGPFDNRMMPQPHFTPAYQQYAHIQESDKHYNPGYQMAGPNFMPKPEPDWRH